MSYISPLAGPVLVLPPVVSPGVSLVSFGANLQEKSICLIDVFDETQTRQIFYMGQLLHIGTQLECYFIKCKLIKAFHLFYSTQ